MHSKTKYSIDTLIKSLEKIYRATMSEKDHRYALKAIEMMAKIRGAFAAEKREQDGRKTPVKQAKMPALEQGDISSLESLYEDVTVQISTLEGRMEK